MSKSATGGKIVKMMKEVLELILIFTVTATVVFLMQFILVYKLESNEGGIILMSTAIIIGAIITSTYYIIREIKKEKEQNKLK